MRLFIEWYSANTRLDSAAKYLAREKFSDVYLVNFLIAFFSSGLILNPNEQFIQKSESSFHLSKASLDLRSCIYEPIQVMYTHNYNSYVMCTLQYGKFFDCAIDLKFKKGDSLSFSTTGGKGTVHLIGYVMDDGEIEPAVGDNMNGEGIV